MTKKCDSLISSGKKVECIAGYKDCPKDRMKCLVGQSCWQVRTQTPVRYKERKEYDLIVESLRTQSTLEQL